MDSGLERMDIFRADKGAIKYRNYTLVEAVKTLTLWA